MAKPGLGTEVVLMDEGAMAAQMGRETPHITSLNVTKSSRVHVGPKFVSVNQTIQNKEMIKGRFLGLELMSGESTRKLRCSVAVFLCWAFLVSSGLAIYLVYVALWHQVRLDIDLPFHKYVWSIIRNTTKAERLSCLAATTALIVVILLIIYYTLFMRKTDQDQGVNYAPHEWNITREMWLADDFHHNSTTDTYDPLKLVIIQHTVGAECHTFSDCSAYVRRLQEYFLKDLKYDIPYNFLIGNDGRVYEGRGWNREGAHTYTFNRCSLGIGFIGDYRNTNVTTSQVERLNLLLAEGVSRGHLDPNYYIVPAKDLQSTESPGTNLYNLIKQWHTYDHKLQFRGRSCDQIYGRE
ncbi:peptidoglycan-recognition protein LB-like isoform X3 [Ostrinia furnacalis]|uniref:peptidoglycan-recognition protein LB-like isoform X3 n=1 Tax=Ostrinia furnacalis TaxID=93504 RepID=UPI00103D14D7|nr:peptidoglycan-recognition protein LB-like isoform X3 [Ostrinia furnacalis]